MKEDDVFRTKEEELHRLAEEIAGIKSAIKEISAAVDRIERHAKRSFGISPKSGGSRASSRGAEKKLPKEQPLITPNQALQVFDELSEKWDRERPQEVEDRLQNMPIADLKVIAHELGVTFTTKPSKKSFCNGIIGRLNERNMLSKNINVTPSHMKRVQKKEK